MIKIEIFFEKFKIIVTKCESIDHWRMCNHNLDVDQEVTSGTWSRALHALSMFWEEQTQRTIQKDKREGDRQP